MFSPSAVYALDIETDTTPTIGPDGEPDYNPGLDPLLGSVTEVVIATGSPTTTTAYAVGGDLSHDELALLATTHHHVRSLSPGLIATWNGSFFDLPFLHTRHRLTGVPGGPDLTHQDGLFPKYEAIRGHGPDWRGLDRALGHSGGYSATWEADDGHHAHLDIAPMFKAYAANTGIPWRLKDVARAHGIEVIEVDRERMHLLTAAEREAYVLSDGDATRLLALIALGLA